MLVWNFVCVVLLCWCDLRWFWKNWMVWKWNVSWVLCNWVLKILIWCLLCGCLMLLLLFIWMLRWSDVWRMLNIVWCFLICNCCWWRSDWSRLNMCWMSFVMCRGWLMCKVMCNCLLISWFWLKSYGLKLSLSIRIWCWSMLLDSFSLLW